ncbi:MAG: hypothetical protein PHP55_00930 [Methanoculleus sp.]|nr:hypothetical protein [Methanoculleus sp.]
MTVRITRQQAPVRYEIPKEVVAVSSISRISSGLSISKMQTSALMRQGY